MHGRLDRVILYRCMFTLLHLASRLLFANERLTMYMYVNHFRRIMASKIKSSSSCEFCSQLFSDPRMLPCLHSFCYSCLSKHFQQNLSKHRICPTCKETFDLPGGKLYALPKDLHSSYVAEVVGYEQMIKEESNLQKCDRCSDESDDFKFCCTCCMHVSVQLVLQGPHKVSSNPQA